MLGEGIGTSCSPHGAFGPSGSVRLLLCCPSGGRISFSSRAGGGGPTPPPCWWRARICRPPDLAPTTPRPSCGDPLLRCCCSFTFVPPSSARPGLLKNGSAPSELGLSLGERLRAAFERPVLSGRASLPLR